MEINLAILFACHFLGDFGLRPNLFEGKNNSWLLLTLHCLTYASTFIVFLKISWLIGLILFLSHLTIDPLISYSKLLKWHLYDSVWIDQGLHLAVLLIIYFVLIKG